MICDDVVHLYIERRYSWREEEGTIESKHLNNLWVTKKLFGIQLLLAQRKYLQ